MRLDGRGRIEAEAFQSLLQLSTELASTEGQPWMESNPYACHSTVQNLHNSKRSWQAAS